MRRHRWNAINENISSATRNVFTLIISNKERKKTNITIYKKCYIEQSYKSRDMEVKAEEINWKQTKKQIKKKKIINRSTKETLRLFWEFFALVWVWTPQNIGHRAQICSHSVSIMVSFRSSLWYLNIRCVVTQPAVVYWWYFAVWHRSWSRYPSSSSSALDCSDSHMSPDVGHMYKHTTSAQ